ncbi:MAG: ATP-dependent DNA helicase RecQ, partial [Epsilonproteobacteria bacterium]|nr:ATP-dependent DNA helicase RecQ [Campylobacterota bacterium]
MFVDKILFLDLEVNRNEKIEEIGLVIGEERLRTSSLAKAKEFILLHNPKLLVGHNLFKFDNLYLKSSKLSFLTLLPSLDTLPISLLLFSEKTFHSLPKEYKDEDNFFNDPLKDALLTKRLLKNSVERFNSLPPFFQAVFYSLLRDKKEFANFFTLIKPPPFLAYPQLLNTIISNFPTLKNVKLLKDSVLSSPIQLAYILSLTHSIIKAHPPKILYEYPDIVELHKKLTSFEMEEIVEFMYQTFGFSGFREFVAVDDSSFISQRDIVLETLKDNSLIAILPTGGGKTFTFWLPALFRASRIKSLTVVISPLQALIQDQLKNFQQQVANFTAVAISGYQSYLERADAIEKVINGEADILYLAPESLRSETTFKILKNRVIERFVIDEAHCLSIWGHDFRHDYFYIAEFIEELLKVQPWAKEIPVSCFSATAKSNVIEDIQNYFKEKLSLTLTSFIAKPERKNLNYYSILVKNEEEKFSWLLKLLKETPALVYIPSSTKKCENIALELQTLGFNAKPFHAKLEKEEKSLILKEFIEDKLDIVVATTAFGMGVDKPNIKTVIHYEVSNSLENYVQEAGRGARDPTLTANCYTLFLEDDLDNHFLNLNLNKISSNEINSIFRALKSKNSKEIYITSRELALKAGWDIERGDWDSKVKTALLELERAGYLQRKRNKVRFFASSIVKDPFDKLASYKKKLSPQEYQLLILTLNALLGRGKPKATQLDEIAFILDHPREEIARAILKLKELKILRESWDIQLTLKRNAKRRFEEVLRVEKGLINFFKKHPFMVISLRSLNEHLIDEKIVDRNVTFLIQELLKSWRRKKELFHFSRIDRVNDLWRCEVVDIERLEKTISLKRFTTQKVLYYLLKLNSSTLTLSLLEIAKSLELDPKMIDRALFYLHSFEIIELGEGRFIYYSPMHIV